MKETISASKLGEILIPASFRPSSGAFAAVVHFQLGGRWAQEMFRQAGIDAVHYSSPLSGMSNQFARPFASDPELFGAILNAIEAAVRAATGDQGQVLGTVAITSFSAGYGAVREILKQPRYFERIGMLVMADSIYASFTDPETRIPTEEHMTDFVRFARAASRGDKTMVVTHVDYDVADYCSTRETADALLRALGAEREPVDGGQFGTFPLSGRCDRAGFHLLHFGRETGVTHMDAFAMIGELLKTFWSEAARRCAPSADR